MCGYCGTHEGVSKFMEIDHFVPDNVDSSRKCDYSNLVYACFTCNRKKSGKWPTRDKNKPHDGYEGFADPATREFDAHLGRNADGAIEYYTDVGKYMFKTAFKFDIRPTKAIWRASQLYELTDKLDAKVNTMSPSEKEVYIATVSELFKLQKYLSGETK
jgi:hypothetical protein